MLWLYSTDCITAGRAETPHCRLSDGDFASRSNIVVGYMNISPRVTTYDYLPIRLREWKEPTVYGVEIDPGIYTVVCNCTAKTRLLNSLAP